MRKIAAVIIAALAALSLSAQNTIRVEAPNLVASDEQFNVTFIIEGENQASDFSWSQGDDFQLMWGPQRGSSTSIQIINGKRSKSSQSTYTYILIPRKTGTLTLPAASAVIKGRTITSSPVKIEVVGQNASSSSHSSSTSSSSSERTGDVNNQDIFMRLSLSRTKVVVGEPVTATLKLYQKVNIAGFENAKFPTFNGFWSQETYTPTNIEFHRENVGNTIYDVAVLRSYVLIPQQVGTITIEPAELVCLVNVRVNNTSSNSIFDSFFQDDHRTIRKRITTPAINVHVSSLPAGAPASFGGGVGSFRMEASVNADSLRANDAGTLKVRISGKGNVALLEAPKVNFPPDFEVYDSKAEQNTDAGSGGTSGSKTFEFPFIPRSAGEFIVGPLEYSYYDINSGKYVTLRTDTLKLKVLKGSGSEAVASQDIIPSGVAKKGVKNLGDDIRYISTKAPAFRKGSSFFIGGVGYWVLFFIIVAGGVSALVCVKYMAVRRADVAGTKNRRATKMALRRLKEAEGYLAKNLYSAFYEELHKALLGYVADKLNMNAADLSKDRIAAGLSSKGVAESLVADFVGLLDACEFARYSPDAGHEAMNAHYEAAVKTISSIDSSMKKGTHTSKVVTVLVALLAFSGVMKAEAAAPADSLWNAGCEAYAAGNYAGAARAWNTISADGVQSAVLYYNLGNAFFKCGETGRAVLYYEKALKLNPSFSDARFNLEFAQNSVQDRIDAVPEFILSTAVRKVCWLLGSNAWAVLSLLFFAAFVAGTLVFLLSLNPSIRRVSFYSAIVVLVLLVFSMGFSLWQKNEAGKADQAIVMLPVSSVKSSPASEGSKDLFILHEGTKVKVLDEVGEWINIEIADGRQGWIKTTDIEKI